MVFGDVVVEKLIGGNTGVPCRRELESVCIAGDQTNGITSEDRFEERFHR
jgi:hypothetical protein